MFMFVLPLYDTTPIFAFSTHKGDISIYVHACSSLLLFYSNICILLVKKVLVNALQESSG
jgi:hypothetical protein